MSSNWDLAILVNDFSDYSSVSLPSFLAFLSVVFEKVLIRLEDGHVVETCHIEMGTTDQHKP